MTGVENPHAFPTAVQPGFEWAHDGMTLRDWFAGQALASAETQGNYSEWQLKAWFGQNAVGITREQIAAKASYAMADAMLAERSRVPAR